MKTEAIESLKLVKEMADKAITLVEQDNFKEAAETVENVQGFTDEIVTILYGLEDDDE